MRGGRVPTIKKLLEKGQYHIDPYAIADAILHWTRPHGSRGLDAADAAQNECSKPDSSSSVSMKATPAGPSTTAPIQVRPAFAAGKL
jgi:hypothetical protein